MTLLNNNGGVINGKHSFTKIKATDIWIALKVGSKLKYLLFDNEVVSLDLIEASWDDADLNKNIVIPQNTFKEGYNTELRTVMGTIEAISDGIITINVGKSKEYVLLQESSEWTYMDGDNLRLECITTQDESTWNPTMGTFGKIVNVNKLTPNSIKYEIGRVTATFDDYAVFEESIILHFSVMKSDTIEIKLHETYEFEAIETSILLGGRNFNWRVTKIIRKIDTVKGDCSSIDSYMKIQFNDENLNLRQSSREITKFISIFNNSDQKLTVTKCEISSNSGFFQLQNPDKRFDLRPFNGAFKIYFNIIPRQTGSFVEEVTVDFGHFKRRCLITLNVRNNDNSRSNRRCTEIIPGQKLCTTPRFIEIRIPDFNIPNDFRTKFDHKKQTQLIVQDFSQSHYHFMIEMLNEQNYMAKMRTSLYLEEIAMEIFFERYRIDRAHFENNNEYLRLEIEGVSEKRPSIAMGDSLHASELFISKGNKQVFQGIIHRVEQDAILAKFHSEFHRTHDRKDFHIEFCFSRTTYKRQHYALQQVVSLNGLGLDFLFPKDENINRNIQLDVTLSKNGKLLMNGDEEEFFNQALNTYQKTAVINVLRGESRPLPYIIYGNLFLNN